MTLKIFKGDYQMTFMSLSWAYWEIILEDILVILWQRIGTIREKDKTTRPSGGLFNTSRQL